MKPQDEAIFKEPSATQQEREQQARAQDKKKPDAKPDADPPPRRGEMSDPAFDDRPRREDDQLSHLLSEDRPAELPSGPDNDNKE